MVRLRSEAGRGEMPTSPLSLLCSLNTHQLQITKLTKLVKKKSFNILSNKG